MEAVEPTEVTPVAGVEPVVAPVTPEPQTLGWKTELPESIRGNEVFAPYKTKTDLWNGHIEAVNKIKDLEGKLEAATPKLVESPDEYEIPVPEGVQADEGLMKWAKETFHTAKLSKEQAALIGEGWNTFISEKTKAMQEAQKAASDAAVNELKQEWGAKFDENSAIVKRMMDKVAEKHKPWLMTADDPNLGRLLVDLAPNYLDDSVPPGSPNSGPSGDVETQARAFYEKPTGG